MQGKFQLVLMPTAGHAIHEDEAAATAEHLSHFLTRFRVRAKALLQCSSREETDMMVMAAAQVWVCGGAVLPA